MPKNHRKYSQEPRVLIAVATRERPRLLGELLNSLHSVVRPDGVSFSLLVVENDVEEASRDVVETVETGFDTQYRLEPQIGLVSARNRIFDEAIAADVDWILALDDDQRVDANWLTEHLEAMHRLPDARIFSGPYVFHYRQQLSPWFAPFAFRERAFGDVLRLVAGGNAAIHRDVFHPDGAHLRFDEDFQFQGGEDIEFFLRAREAGFETYWVPDAIVHEDMKPERLSMRAILHRRRTSQRNLAHIRHKHTGAVRGVLTNLRLALRSLLVAIANALYGGVLMLFDRAEGRLRLGVALTKLTRIVGICDFYLGRSFEPYKKVIGD